MPSSIRHFASLAELSEAAAEMVLAAGQAAVAARGRFALVLAGGATPATLYRLLAAPPFAARMPWDKTLFFWGDERCVPPEHPDSNFRIARETLLAASPIPANNILRIHGELADPREAASQYETTIRARLGNAPFDLVLLGMGTDGHVASLFPGSPLLGESLRLVGVMMEPQGVPPLPRVTLTLAGLNQSRAMLVLISGEEKRRMLQKIMAQGPASPSPAARLDPREQLVWLTTE
ncbi:MAG: 6-phosphogluconolactonase [Thermodesulfobacteriota bacterium]